LLRYALLNPPQSVKRKSERNELNSKIIIPQRSALNNNNDNNNNNATKKNKNEKK